MNYYRLIIFFIGFVSVSVFGEETSILYLTWLHDPTSTMTVQWHVDSKKNYTPTVFYQNDTETEWHEQKGAYCDLRPFEVGVNTVELTHLEPGKDYRFRVEDDATVYRFRTMPTTNVKPVKFVVAGDAYYYLYLLRKMNIQIAKTNPDFVVVGGDIAYTNGHMALFKGKDWEIKRWQTFLKQWKEHMKTSDGRLIPMVAVIGNHDIKRSFVKTDAEGNEYSALTDHPEPLFFKLFAMPEQNIPYRTLDFGSYLSLILLDTGHCYPIGGEQKQWLKETLEARGSVAHKIAAYHISAYPSVYRYEASTPTKLRKEWVPLFEAYGLDAAFEHHNHSYKRTYPIKEGKVDPNGVVYLGDGAWGVPPRKTLSAKKTWYLAKASQKNNFWQVTIDQEKCLFRSFDMKGSPIESVAKPY